MLNPWCLKWCQPLWPRFLKKAKDMDAQGLSNWLWASAQLKKVALVVLEAVPVIVSQIPSRAMDMNTQALSNCLWASAQLKDEVPKVLENVPAMVGENLVEDQRHGSTRRCPTAWRPLFVFVIQSLKSTNFLVAGGSMDDILSAAAVRLNTLLPRLRGKDFSFTVPVVIWACAKAGVYDGKAVWIRLRSALAPVPNCQPCRTSVYVPCPGRIKCSTPTMASRTSRCC